jgi:hypothetical protein
MLEDFPGIPWLGSDWMTIIDGVRAWLRGQNPYLPYTTYAHTLTPPGWYVYPPHSVYILAPLALLPRGFSFILGVIATWLIWEWWMRREVAMPAFRTLLWWPLIDHFLLGQFSLLVLLALSAVWICWNRPNLFWWGPFVLACATIKPQLVLLPLLVMLFRAVRERKWTFLVALSFWLTLMWGGAWVADHGTLYREWWTSIQTHSTVRRWLLQDWFCVAVTIGILIAYYKHVRQFDLCYVMMGLTVYSIPLGSSYSIIGLLFPILTMKKSINPLFWGISLIAFLMPEITSQGLQVQVRASLVGLLASLIMIREDAKMSW